MLAKKRHWVDCALAAIDPVEVDTMVTSCARTITRLQRALPSTGPPARALAALQQDVADLADQLPVIEVLCNPALRPRHWAEI